MENPSISVIVTTFNEGDELRRTLSSVRRNTQNLNEIIVVDDGSNDGSCDKIIGPDVRVVRHDCRAGVAVSRDEGSRLARGDVLCYLDAHQRVGHGCLDRCARVAMERVAITCPDLRNYGFFNWRLHGAEFQLCPVQGYFSGRWRLGFARPGISQITGLRAPPYLIPRALYSDVAWSRSLQGWGGSEAAIVMKAFFANIPILHVAGPLARHRFQNVFTYDTSWEGIWRNQAIIARICFDDETWWQHWFPQVFAPHLTESSRRAIESPEVLAEHDAFAKRKVRKDCQFWTELLQSTPPL